MTHVHDLNALHTESTLGENQEVTREGFLLCKNVPIARTGSQDYLNDEICDEDDTDNALHGARGKNGIVRVLREEADVFRPETMASFEGKDVVDDHPDDPVHPGNYKQHTVGVTLNVRRGEGAFANFIVADLLIKDEAAIAAVRAGKREVSCGYDAEYEVKGPGLARQYDIIGNHVALVDRGRCGFRCAIGDKEPDMKTKDKNEVVRDAAARGLLRRMLDAIKGGDRKTLDKLMDEMEKEKEGDEAPDAPALEATGTHIHLHLGGEEEAKGKDPSKAGAADEEEEPGEGEDPQGKKEAAGDPNGTRLTALEGAVNQLAESMRKLVARLGGDGGEEEEEAEGDSEGEEEAEGEDPEMDEAEAEEEPKDPKAKKDVAMTGKAGLLKGKGIDKSKDKMKDKAIKDSAHLKDDFVDAKSGAEILAPGLKMPTFDSKAPAKLTTDGICLLKRRALAAATRDEKNGGKDAVTTMLGKKPLNGLDCGAVDTVFNGAVALMKDRNTSDDTTTVGRVRIGKAKDQAPAPKTIGELNNANRAHYKQTKLPGA